MGKLLTFNRLKIGEVVLIEINDEELACEVLAREGNDLYKLRALEGPYRGKFLYFEMIEYEEY